MLTRDKSSLDQRKSVPRSDKLEFGARQSGALTIELSGDRALGSRAVAQLKTSSERADAVVFGVLRELRELPHGSVGLGNPEKYERCSFDRKFNLIFPYQLPLGLDCMLRTPPSTGMAIVRLSNGDGVAMAWLLYL